MGHAHYAWIIDKDHLYAGEDYLRDEAGVIGPRDAAAADKDGLKAAYAHRFQFRMYDDDGILYYTGTLFCDDDAPDEEACYGPLADFGMPAAGCVLIKYRGRPDMDCG